MSGWMNFLKRNTLGPLELVDMRSPHPGGSTAPGLPSCWSTANGPPGPGLFYPRDLDAEAGKAASRGLARALLLLTQPCQGWDHGENKGPTFPLRTTDTSTGLVCCDSWGRKESDTTAWLNWTELNQLKLHDDWSNLPLYVWHLILLLTNYTFRVLLVIALSTQIKGAESLCVDVCIYVSTLLSVYSP